MRKKQGLLVIMDGLGDRPNPSLGGMTPLESASTPNMERLLKMGMCGNVYPIAPGIPVGTDVGHLQIFGYDSSRVYRGRGPLEASSGGLELMDGDVAFRGNFATVTEDKVVVDRRAGRISQGTELLAEAVNGMVLSDGTRVLAKELTEHRIAVVLRGEGLSDTISCTDPGTTEEGKGVSRPKALDGTAKAQRTADALWEFTEKAYGILRELPLNRERVEKGLKPANIILTRGAGQKTEMVSLKEKYNIRAACVAGDKTVGGIARLAGMDYYIRDSFTGSFDTDLMGKAGLAAGLLKEKGYDWVVLHIKGTDLAGHDNRPDKKKDIVERTDQMLGYLLDELDLEQCYISFTADHSTPCQVGDHSGDGVPTFIAGSDVRRDKVELAGERYFMEGALEGLTANDIFRLQMNYMGFMEKVGS
ncbi:MAG: 2,3-bisphosphoglycerate-independent phosphoglycerate mutase [Clostridia bacterium]|nr:2,3-bisphosphoglycerate-independent phosphoglycerate mutase [Clostridia bacterium]